MRCIGPCGRDLHESQFLEHKPGQRRKVCRECFNAGRKGTRADLVGNIEAKVKAKLVEEKITDVQEHRLKIENRQLRERNAELVHQLSEGGEYNDIVKAALAMRPRAPSIHPRERKSGLREGCPLILASDWHIEQEVRPEQVAGRNRYNLQISKKRMQNFWEAVVWTVKQQSATYRIRDIILWLGGDFIQNFLHEDDVENNLLAPLDAIAYWLAETEAGLRFLLDKLDFEQALIPENDGNHARLTKKMRAATRMQHSLETFAYAQLALRFKDEKRLKFILPTSQFTFLDDVYGRTIRFLHGDVFKFHGGVGGITVPLFRAQARWEKTKRADLTCMGHWHQRYCLPDLMVNGSLIGFDPFAMSIGAALEQPAQSMRMIDARRWVGADVPLYVADREDDIMNAA